MSLPFLPGYNLPESPNGKKKQTLVYRNGYAVPAPTPVSPVKPATPPKSPTGSTRGSVDMNLSTTWDPSLTYGTLRREKTPPKEQFSHTRVLGFESYYTEPVPFSDLESLRIRRVAINFFLDDQTIMLKESTKEKKVTGNTGIPGGILLKRQRINKQGSNDPYTERDFNVGADIFIYGRTYHIVSCDFFTERYLSDTLGMQVPPEEEVPENVYATKRKQIENPTRVYDPNPNKGILKKFLENDKKVLRFYCYWDNRDSLFGELLPYTLHYYLVDDTIEVRADKSKDGFPVFLKKQKLPKGKEFLTFGDLQTGTTIDIFGRQFFIYDCDGATREFYKSNYNINQDSFSSPVQEEPSLASTATNRPPTRGGFWEAPPKKNFQKMLDNDRKILRYAGKLVSNRPEDKERIFIVSYYLADDTIGVFEPPQRNSGILGGKFLERRQLLKPNSKQYYQANDLFVGAILEVFGSKFQLHNADEYAFNHMEANVDDFPMSDIELVQQKLGQAIRAATTPDTFESFFQSLDKDNNGYLSVNEFRDAVKELGFKLTEQEIITIVRRYDLDGDGTIKFNLNNEIRRISVQKQPNFEEVSEILNRLYGSKLSNVDFALRYIDSEGDLVTVSSTEELEEAFRNFTDKHTARFSVLPIEKDDEGNLHPKPTVLTLLEEEDDDEPSAEDVQNLFAALLGLPRQRPTCPLFAQRRCGPCPRPQEQEKVLHHAFCDHCNSRIVGLRFKCTNCPDFDLCEKCFPSKNEKHDPSHIFLRTARPLPPHLRFRPCAPKQETVKTEETKADSVEVTSEKTEEVEPEKEKTEEVKSEETVAISEPVKEAEVETIVVEAEEEKKELSPFEVKLKQLEEMGFVNRERNIEILVKRSGDLVKAIRDLLE